MHPPHSHKPVTTPPPKRVGGQMETRRRLSLGPLLYNYPAMLLLESNSTAGASAGGWRLYLFLSYSAGAALPVPLRLVI